MVVYPRAAAFDVIRNVRDYLEKAPDEVTAYAALLTGPDGSALTAVIACYCGDKADAERVLRPLRSFGTPLMDSIQPMPMPAMQSLLAASFSGRQLQLLEICH